MLRYFPFDHDGYDMPMNAKAGVGALIELDESEYLHELALKETILASDYRYYFQCPDENIDLAWDCIRLLLPDMAAHYPEQFKLHCDGDLWRWTNNLKKSEQVFSFGDCSTLPYHPLDWVGREVQEDLIVMAEIDGGDTICVGGQLCFPAGWCLDDKVSENFLRIHEDVPQFLERIGRPADLMMRRLKPGRPTGRLNWTIGTINKLDLPPKTSHDWVTSRRGITAENAGDRCFLRVERQTFSRLPTTRGVLFTIHTYINPVTEVVQDPSRLNRFTAAIKGIPRPTREYKGMAAYADDLINYLEALQRRTAGAPPTTVPGMREERTVAHKREPVMGNICYSTVNTSFWEPMPLDSPDMLEGDPDPKVHWLKKNEKGEKIRSNLPCRPLASAASQIPLAVFWQRDVPCVRR